MHRLFGQQAEKEGSVMFRSFIGSVERNMLAVVALSPKKWAIAKVSEHTNELLTVFKADKPQKMLLTSLQ